MRSCYFYVVGIGNLLKYIKTWVEVGIRFTVSFPRK